MTKSNQMVMGDYARSTWLGHHLISHNRNLLVCDNILFSYGIPMAVYERDKFCPYRINMKLMRGKHKEHFDMLMKAVLKYNKSNMYLLMKGNLKVENYVKVFDKNKNHRQS